MTCMSRVCGTHANSGHDWWFNTRSQGNSLQLKPFPVFSEFSEFSDAVKAEL